MPRAKTISARVLAEILSRHHKSYPGSKARLDFHGDSGATATMAAALNELTSLVKSKGERLK